MATYGGFNFTSFKGVNLKNTAAIRVESDGKIGTLAVKESMDTDKQWFLPDKSGTLPIAGTFNVSLPVIAAGTFYRTAITVSGLRTEDGIVVTIQGDPLKNAGAIQNPAQLVAAQPANGSITLTFACLGGTTTAYQEIPCAYVAVR